jgi:hypothetical protein
VSIYQSRDEFSVRIRQMHLEANEIEVNLFDQKDSSYGAFGYIYLSVKISDEAKALALLKQYDE